MKMAQALSLAVSSLKTMFVDWIFHHRKCIGTPQRLSLFTPTFIPAYKARFSYFKTCCKIVISFYVNPLRTVVVYMRQGNIYFTVRKQIIVT